MFQQLVCLPALPRLSDRARCLHSWARMAIGTTEHPLRVAIVGSGPAGFYAAGHLLKCKSHPDLCVSVDLFDRLPTPWGLVRAGVAPDHPNIKAVSRVYEKTAEHPEFRFYGNRSEER